MRSELIHAYHHHRIDLDIVWDAAVAAIPELIEQFESLIPFEEVPLEEIPLEEVPLEEEEEETV